MAVVSYLLHHLYVSGWQRRKLLLLVLVATLSSVSCSAESEKVYVPEGDNVELKCPYFSTTTPVIWQNTRGLLFDGYEIAKKLTLRNKMKITGNSSVGQFNLKIFNVSSSDVGIYVCGTYMNFGKETHQHRVSVHITDPPKIKLVAVPSAVVIEGSSVTLFCNDDSFPESNYVKWTKDKTSFGKANDQLKIDFQQTHRDDAGSYTCIVRNELGQARASLQLTVLYAPNVSVSLLKNGNILCNASGVPSVYIFSRWEHLSEFGTHIRYLDGSHDGILNISSGVDSVPYLNNGKYICTVQNGISDRFNKVNQTGYIFIQYQGRPFCLNVSGRTRANFDYEHMVTIKIAVEAFSISTYDTVEWLHGVIATTELYQRYDENRSKKEYLYYAFVPLCFLALSGWLAFLFYCKKRRQLVLDHSNDSMQQGNQEVQIITNYYEEINENELLNQSSTVDAIEPSFSTYNRSEISSESTDSNYDAVEHPNLPYINPHQQLLGSIDNVCHKYASLKRSHEYFIVIDSNLSNTKNLKRHTY